MKIAIFADIHSVYPVFKMAYDDAIAKNIDMCLYLGDYLTDGFDGEKVIDIIRNSNAHVIRGNREDYILEYNKIGSITGFDDIQNEVLSVSYKYVSNDTISYIGTLPIFKIIDLNGIKVCISHGSPYNVREMVYHDSYDLFDKLIDDFDCKIYLFGHSHEHFNIKYKDKLFINPGSIGLPSGGDGFKYGILNIDDEIKYESIDIDYEYEKLENYYKTSNYYTETQNWCNLILDQLKTRDCFVSGFFKEMVRIRKNCDLTGMSLSDIHQMAYENYIKRSFIGMQDNENKKAKNVLKFYLEMTSLKDKLRQGLVDFKIDRERIESVAEHVYGVMIFAVAIQAEYKIDVDISKVIKMLLFHETEEVIIGDLPEFMQHYGAHSQYAADLATDKIFSYICNIDEYHSLVNEFNKRETKEARFAYMCDKLEHIILVKTYEDEGCNDLSRVTNEKILNNPKIKKIIDDGATSVADIFFEYSRGVLTDESFKEVLEYLETINTSDLRQES